MAALFALGAMNIGIAIPGSPAAVRAMGMSPAHPMERAPTGAPTDQMSR